MQREMIRETSNHPSKIQHSSSTHQRVEDLEPVAEDMAEGELEDPCAIIVEMRVIFRGFAPNPAFYEDTAKAQSMKHKRAHSSWQSWKLKEVIYRW